MDNIEKEIAEKFATKLRMERAKRKISQEVLAEKAGLSTPYIGRVERSLQNITLGKIQKIADAFNLPIHKLLIFDED